MQKRTPLNFWLLLTATLAVDGVVVAWGYVTTLDRAGNLYFALVCGQISAVCIGCSLSPLRRRWWWVGPLAVCTAVAILTTWLRHDPNEAYQNFLLYLSLWLPHAAILLAILWLLRQTSVAKRWGYQNDKGSWQFSVAHLLSIMTALAVLLAILRTATEMHRFWIELAIWITNNVMLAIAALIIYSTRWLRPLRAAAILGVSLVLAFATATLTQGHPDSLEVNLIQALVLVMWLAVGEIVPARGAFSDDDSAALVS
jgi:hypothetical protein